MKYRNLGRSGLSVSRICLGTMNFGPERDEETSHAIMDAALEHEINFFDTANRYGGAGHWGRTEEILGRWFQKGGQRREKVVLATKLYGETSRHFTGLISEQSIYNLVFRDIEREVIPAAQRYGIGIFPGYKTSPEDYAW